MSVRRTAFWVAFAAGGLIAVVLGAVDVASGVPVNVVSGRTALSVGLAALLATAGSAVVGRALSSRLADLSDAADAQAHQPADLPPPTLAADAEIARVQRAFARMNAAMHALLERERSFTRYASHELRTPVGAIKVQIERIEIGAATPAEVLPAVLRQTRRIEELIDALLTLARARELGGPIRDLDGVLDEVIDAQAEGDRVYLVEPVPEVTVRDAVLVAQALRNLIDNAVRHGTGPVAVRAERDGADVILRVRDMGPGIPATELRRLAEPVGRRAPRPDGHGLGLTLVALIARALDGRLLLHNTEIGLEASLTVKVAVDAPR